MDEETRRNLGLLVIAAIFGVVFLALSASTSEGVAQTGQMFGGLGVLTALFALFAIARSLFRARG